MAKELLLEIGTEEIPAAFMPRALAGMKTMMAHELAAQRIAHGDIITMGTPRRLVIAVKGMAERQEDQFLEKIGPPVRTAYDAEGKPTKAATGFAAGQGIDVAELVTVATDKGDYICARKTITGEATRTVLPSLLARFITAIPFPKSMRWMNLSLRFARPIHWIAAIFGGEVVPFRIENIESGAASCGHRFLKPKPFTVKNFSDYLKKTKARFVIVDPEERRANILDEARAAARGVGGHILEHEALIDELTFLVEYPSAVCGSFEKEYLALPADVLTTAMMKHQKYFPVMDDGGRLLPHFITITNTPARDPGLVARGNEKVIRARLADARFFFEEDKKVPLEARMEELKGVVFHSLLGTSYEKVLQFRELALFMAEKINPALTKKVDRGAYLCKADLETQMIYEFPELQGIMGREYALIQGEDPVVAKAMYEHYLPIAAGGALPETDEGSLISIADKMDTIAGCFGVGLIPTGTADPYALRRQALGIINIILNKKYPLALDDIADKSIAILSKKLRRPPEEVKADVLEFFKGRLENQMISLGHPYDVVAAVLILGACDLVQTVKKIEAVESFRGHPDFEPLVIAFKRVVNILKNFQGGTVDPAGFENREEETLYRAFTLAEEKAGTLIDTGDYQAALSEMATLRKPVDAFFETVLVMAENPAVRGNRLSLLAGISSLFFRIADFSKLVVESR